jgi:uncharacterized membrane protein
MDYLIPLVTSLLPRLPAVIVLGVGIGLAISRSRSHPRTAMLAAIGFGSYLLVGLVSGVFFGVAPLVLMENGMETSMGTVYAVAGVVFSIIEAGALGLIVAAVFSERARGGHSNPGHS